MWARVAQLPIRTQTQKRASSVRVIVGKLCDNVFQEMVKFLILLIWQCRVPLTQSVISSLKENEASVPTQNQMENSLILYSHQHVRTTQTVLNAQDILLLQTQQCVSCLTLFVGIITTYHFPNSLDFKNLIKMCVFLKFSRMTHGIHSVRLFEKQSYIVCLVRYFCQHVLWSNILLCNCVVTRTLQPPESL